MKILVHFCLFCVLCFGFTKITFSASSQGDSGSSMVHFKVRVVGIDLEKEDGSFVPFYTKGGYMFTKSEGSNSVVAKLRSSYPQAGTYVGLRLRYDAFKIKLKIVKNGITYYTTEQTINHGEYWPLSESEGDYGFLTILESSVQSMSEDFAIPLVVEESKRKTLDLSWVLQRNGKIFYDTDGILGGIGEFTQVTWAAEEDVIRTFISGAPDKLIQFTFTVNLDAGGVHENIVSILVDETGHLLGGYCHRPPNKAMVCQSLLDGSVLTNILSNGDSADFNLRYAPPAGEPDGTYILTGNYNCDTGYSSLALLTEGAPALNFDHLGVDTIVSSGTVTCKEVNAQNY
jgi:hypothetical protein